MISENDATLRRHDVMGAGRVDGSTMDLFWPRTIKSSRKIDLHKQYREDVERERGVEGGGGGGERKVARSLQRR